MRNRMRGLTFILVGVALGVGLTAPVAKAAEYFQATRSTQTFYVDGKNVELEAYEIDGYNYVKLRDMLIDRGVLRTTDSEYAAIQYYTPIFFFAQKWLFSGSLTDENKDAFRKDAYRHIQHFFSELGGVR